MDILGEDYKNDEWSDDAVYDSLPTATKHGEVIDKVEHDQDQREESKNRVKAEKSARLEKFREHRDLDTDGDGKNGSGHSAPAGEVGGYYPGESTLPPPRSPVTAFLRVATPPGGSQEQEEHKHSGEAKGRKGESGKKSTESKLDDDVLKKIYDSMMKKHTD